MAILCSPWRRWLSVLLTAAIVGGIPATASVAIYLFAAVGLDVLLTGIGYLTRKLFRLATRRRT